jgi:glucosamine-6-phosphate deaminase
MRLWAREDPAAAVQLAADLIAEFVRQEPRATLALPTGRTMIPLYAELAKRHQAGELHLAEAAAFNLDELVLPFFPHPASFATYMEHHGWEPIGLDRNRCDIPNPQAPDLEQECRRYDAAIAAAGGFDLAIVGVGADGHVAYNLPGEPLQTTHSVTLPDEVASTLDLPAAARPLRAITIGFAPLLRARRLLMLATSPEKRAAIERVIDGPDDPAWPCSLLWDHPDFDLVVTQDLL